MLRRIMFFWVYFIPWIILGGAIKYWMEVVSNPLWVLFLIALPTLYGYIVPGVGILLMKKWKFHGPFTYNGIYLHHGLKYAANINLVFLVIFADAYKSSEIGIQRSLGIILGTAFAQGYLIWLHDTFSMRIGKLEIKNIFAKSGTSPEEKVFRYAPGTFFIIGLMYSTCSILFYRNYIKPGLDSTLIFLCYLFSSLLAMIISTSIYFHFQEQSWKKKLEN